MQQHGRRTGRMGRGGDIRRILGKQVMQDTAQNTQETKKSTKNNKENKQTAKNNVYKPLYKLL